MTEQQNSYRQIMKATSIFGGVQVFQIIIGIIRSKFVAVLLGPTGMGISGLLAATTGIIAGLTNFGLATSAVKDISAAHSTGNALRVSTVVTVFRRLVWMTGTLGSFVTLVFSPWLSQISFGNKEYTWAFIWISITLLLNQISIGQGVLLRGMRQIGYMAKSGMIGSVLGLFTTIPLYYFFGIKGIVPGIIVTSVTSLILSWHFARKIRIQPLFVSKLRTIAEGKGMLKMGFMISLSGLITMGASYIVRIFISNTGGVDQVGLYNAGFAIIGTYVGLVFTAMSTDYYPRLSAVANDNHKTKNLINQQAEVAILILAPILSIFLVFINWIIILLYSSKFVAISGMIHWASLGMFFKAISWSIAFVFLSKGASNLYFWNELATNIYLLVLNILGYRYGGLDGLGISFLIGYFLYMLQVFLISKNKYSFSFERKFLKIISIQLILVISCFFSVKLLSTSLGYIVGSLLILASTIHSLIELDNRLNFKEIYRSKFRSN